MVFTIIRIFVFGYIGYQIFDFLHIPGASITGSLVMIAVITSKGYTWAEIPSYIMTFLQVIIGISIGCRFHKEQLPAIKSYLGLSIISSAWMILVSLAVGFLLPKVSPVNLGTALYGSVPVGMVEMGLIALAMNLNVPIVTLLQFSRYLSINLAVPIIVARYNDINNNQNVNEKGCNNQERVGRVGKGLIKIFDGSWVKFDCVNALQVLWLLFLGSIGGFTAKYIGVPVGGILGSMLIIGILRISGIQLTALPQWLIRVAQITIGGCLGTSFLPEILFTLKSLLIPVLFFSFIVVLNGVLLGYIFYKYFKWDLTTSLLANSAGGPTLMTLTAFEMNADVVRVSIIQTSRTVIILLIMPILIPYIIN